MQTTQQSDINEQDNWETRVNEINNYLVSNKIPINNENPKLLGKWLNKQKPST